MTYKKDIWASSPKGMLEGCLTGNVIWLRYIPDSEEEKPIEFYLPLSEKAEEAFGEVLNKLND